jgi:mannitol 2-dehydrogenase
MQPLNAKSLSSLSAPVSTPTYERDRVRTGIVHFGVGGFHRSHQAGHVSGPSHVWGARRWTGASAVSACCHPIAG